MSFPKQEYYRVVRKLLAIGAMLVVIIFFSSFFALNDFARYGISIAFLLGFFYYPLAQKMEKLFCKKIDTICEDGRRAKQGWDGEKKVFGWLEGIVGKECVLKNAHIPGQKFDFDVIIISEKGIIVLEIKNWARWIYFVGNPGYWGNPIGKFKKHLEILQKYLWANNMQSVPIHKAIIFANGKVFWKGKPEIFIIRDKQSLENFIGNIKGNGICSEETRRNIKNLFET